MNAPRIFVTWLLALTVSTSAFAGDLLASIARATQQPDQGAAQRQSIDKKYVWTAGVLAVAGVAVMFTEFLDSGDSKAVRTGAPKGSNLARANIGLGLVATGAVVLALGHARVERAPALTFSPDGVTVSKRVSW